MTLDRTVADDRARFRQQAAEAAASLRSGHGFDPNLCPGFRFTLWRDPFTQEEAVDHAVQSTVHAASDESWIGGTAPPEYDCQFTCIRQSVPWRDEFTAPRPAMSGVFSATVLAEDGEEIHADSLARIKVRPRFDYRGETVAGKAIWVRMLHAWAGSRWGWQHLPRAGTEVGLSFMNGDPDNPVVVGQMYNEDMPPVFPVPSMQTRQGFRSRSTLRGNAQEYSELSFDDKRGEELVLLHAQKNHRVEVEHDQDSTIGNNRTVTTQANDTLTSIIGDITVNAQAGNILVQAAQSITLRVGASSIVLTPDSISLETAGAIMISAGGAVPISAGGDIPITVGGAIELTAGGLVAIEAGGDVNIMGTAVTIEAADGEVDCIPFPI